jgi:hypothetical protein
VEWGTVSVTELAWLLVCVPGIWDGWRMYRPIRDDIAAIERGDVRASPGALALFRNDAATEIDWMVLFGLLSLVGGIAMLRENPPTTSWQGWATVAMLFAAVGWARWRARQRGIRREDHKVRQQPKGQPS